MTIRHLIKHITMVAVIIGIVLGSSAATAHADPESSIFGGTTTELAQDAQAFIADKLKTTRAIGGEVPWSMIIDLNNKFDLAELQEMRDVDTLGVMQIIASKVFTYYGNSELKVACLTGSMVAAYANHHQVTDATSKREMLYALAYTQFVSPGAAINEGVTATTMMEFPEGVAAYDAGVTQGSPICNVPMPMSQMV